MLRKQKKDHPSFPHVPLYGMSRLPRFRSPAGFKSGTVQRHFRRESICGCPIKVPLSKIPLTCGISRFLFRFLECRSCGMQKAADSALNGIQTAEQKAEHSGMTTLMF